MDHLFFIHTKDKNLRKYLKLLKNTLHFYFLLSSLPRWSCFLFNIRKKEVLQHEPLCIPTFPADLHHHIPFLSFIPIQRNYLPSSWVFTELCSICEFPLLSSSVSPCPSDTFHNSHWGQAASTLKDDLALSFLLHLAFSFSKCSFTAYCPPTPNKSVLAIHLPFLFSPLVSHTTV